MNSGLQFFGRTTYNFFNKKDCKVRPLDLRGCPLEIGDEVVYCAEQKITTREDSLTHKTVVEISKPELKQSQIACIQIIYGSGFCEIGDSVTIILSDGHRETGDSENGGWTMLRLPDRGKR